MIDATRLQAAIEPYEDDFDEVLRVIELSSDFILLPIAVVGPDLAEMLSYWLEVKNHAVLELAPETPEDWKNLSTSLLSAKPEKDGVVMVIARGDLPEDLSMALRLVNERRDTLAKHLNCPLLWCGSSEFLVQTGQLAPDFWSVRAVERRIEARPKTESRKEAKKKEAAKDGLLDEALRQGDRKSAEILFLSELRKAMAAGDDDEFDAIVASIPAGYEDADRTFGFELTLMKAEMGRRRHRIGDALKLLDAWEEKLETPDEKSRISLLRGRIWEQAGDTERAEKAYSKAIETQKTNSPVWQFVSFHYHRAFRLRNPALGRISEPDLQLWDDAKYTTDRPVQALIAAIRAEELALDHDIGRATRRLLDALTVHGASINEPTVLFGGEVAEAIQRARRAIERATEERPIKSDIAKELSKVPSPATRSWIAYVAIALVLGLFGISIGFLLSRAIVLRGSNIHCFHGADKELNCAESLDQCEKLRADMGSKRPCQKPLFAP